MKKCIFHKWLQYHLRYFAFLTPEGYKIFHLYFITVSGIIYQHIIFQVFYFPFYGNILVHIADCTSQQSNKGIYSLG